MRLFIAVNLPEPDKQRLGAQLFKIAERHNAPVRWVSSDALHITLKFLGEVADSTLPPLKEAMAVAVAGTRPFDVAIGGFGAFPSSSRPNIFWVGVEATPALLDVQQRIEAAAAALGFAPEDRVFTPHITVGRAQKRVRMDPLAADFDYKMVLHVESVDLMRSHPNPRGVRYEVLEKMELH